MGRHTYSALAEILATDGEAARARYVYRITDGDDVISEEEITGCTYRPARDVLEREVTSAGFVQAAGADGIVGWRLA